MATIKDVAKLACVSTATVSRVINNHPSVTVETRQLVHQAMDQLCYLPSKSAIQLNGKKSGILGVILPNLSNPHFHELVATLEQEAKYFGMHLIIKTHSNDPEVEKSAVQSLISLGAEGLFWVPTENESELVDLIKRSGLNTVVVTQRSKFFDSILVDYRKGATLVAKHFYDLGFSNIGFIGQKFVDNEKLHVLKQSMQSKGIQINDENVFLIEKGVGESLIDHNQDVSQVCEQIINLKSEHIALWVYNDVFTVNLIKELNTKGKRIPEDVSLVSFDDTYIAHLMNITSVTQPISEIARLAYSHIRDSNQNDMIECIQLMPRIITRNTTLRINKTIESI